MDKQLAIQLLETLLRKKKALEAFLTLHSHLSLDEEEDRLELLRLARESKQKPPRLRVQKGLVKAKGKADLRELKIKAAHHDWNKILHTAKTLALCSLPYERVADRTLVRKAQMDDGTIVHVKFSAHDTNIELPYGRDRALITWLMTCAREQGTPRVQFQTAMEFFDAFGLSDGGRAYNDFRSSMERICNVTITYGYESDVQNRERDIGEKLVYDKNLPRRTDVHDETLGLRSLPGIREPYYVEFGQKTFNDLVSNPVSVPLEIMRRYQCSPTAWDFIQFVAWESSNLTEGQEKVIPLESIVKFLGSEEKNPRKIRMKIDTVLDDIGDYLSNVRLIGRGVSSVVVIVGQPQTLAQKTHSPSSADKPVLDGEILKA